MFRDRFTCTQSRGDFGALDTSTFKNFDRSSLAVRVSDGDFE